MAPPQAMTREQANLVNQAIGLLTKGTLDDWNMHYRVREFQQIMPGRTRETVWLDFEYSDRAVFYQCVNERFLKNEPVDYLEFGVASGWSMRSWVGINQDSASRFFGFDSFEGLPEDWNANQPRGTFSQQGKTPDIDDPRVTFVKGLFQDTVESFFREFVPQNRLVIHMDADLYSSTLYCLMNLDRHVVPGTILMFDEFTARNCIDEFAALQDYCRACYRDYKVLASRRDYAKLAVEITRKGPVS